jgi:L-histidine Nalpha-methyltransferase
MGQVKTGYAPAVASAVSGLMGSPKTLPSWLFYDEQGDRLFQEIMGLPEYYITRCEYEILHSYKDDLLSYFNHTHKPFQIIELGSGDGMKTEVLLKHFVSKGVEFIYTPVDLSANVLDQLQTRLLKKLPELNINPVRASYGDAIESLNNNRKKVVFFLGANIGNYTMMEAGSFLQALSLSFTERDVAVIGFDLKKDPRLIEAAYNDSQGVTREFNLNMLRRLNRELGANFDLTGFIHHPYYDPQTGAARSYLVSTKDQEVHIETVRKTIKFQAWESIRTEISQKYDLLMIEKLASDAGLEIVDLFFDADHFFCNVLLKKISL